MRNLVLLIVTLVVTVLGLEGLLRVIPGLLPPTIQHHRTSTRHKMGVGHAYIGHLHTPNTALLISSPDFSQEHHTDAHGFRNSEPWPTTADIVTVGDSLTFGYGVDEQNAWPARLNQALPGLKVVNLGLIGTGPEQQVRVYETFGQGLKPRLLIVGFFLGNDFWDAGLFERWSTIGVGANYMVWRDFGRPEKGGPSVRTVRSRLKSWVQHYSILFHLGRHARDVYRNWKTSEPRYLPMQDGGVLQLWPSHLAGLVAQAQPERPEFQLVVRAFERLQILAHQQGVKILVVMQPNKEQIYLPGLPGLPALDDPVQTPGVALRMELERLGLDYLDLSPIFRQRAQQGEQLFFAVDGHPNQRGYRLIAETVAAHVRQRLRQYGLAQRAARKATTTTSTP